MPQPPPQPPFQNFEVEMHNLLQASAESLKAMTSAAESQAAAMKAIKETLEKLVPPSSSAPKPPGGGAAPPPTPVPSTSSQALSEAAMKRQLLRGVSAASAAKKGKTITAQEFATALDDSEGDSASAGGGAGGSGGGGWLGAVNAHPQYYLAHFPGAHATLADRAKYIATLAANRANKRMAPHVQAMLDLDAAGKATDETGAYTEEYLAHVNKVAGGGAFGMLSRGATNLGQGYMTGQAITQSLKGVTEPLNNLRNYGLQTGATSTSSPMFLGMRSPFDLAGGFGQKSSELGFAFSHNVTPEQSGMIYNNLFQNGWYGGGSTDAMRNAAASMMQNHPNIASQPAYYDMMDKATRYGATSLSEFNTTMAAVPNAAKSAHQSLVDMMGAMQQMGSFNQSIGGTYQGGLNTATDWASGTGLPPQIMQQMMQSPLVSGQIFASTGLPPMMQGLASGAQKSQGIFNALKMVNSAVIGPPTKQYTDPISGLTSTISQQDQKLAMMSQLFPGISPTVLKMMLHNEKGMQAGMNMMGTARIFRNAVAGAVDREHGPDAARHAQDAINDLTGKPWQKIQGAMKVAVDAQGHHIFENWATYRKLEQQNKLAKFLGHHVMSEKEIHHLAQQQAISYVDNAGDTAILKNATESQLESVLPGGRNALQMLNGSERASIAKRLLASGQVSGKTEKAIAEARKKAMENNVNRNTQKFGPGSSNNNGPQVTIGLSKAASKFFNLVGAPTDAKANKNAGAQAANTANISLPSYPPSTDTNVQSNDPNAL